MMDLTYLTIEDMDRMPIGKLRDVATFIGVKSPTTLSKDALIKATFIEKHDHCKSIIKDGPEIITKPGRKTGTAKGEYTIDWEKVPERFLSDEEYSEILSRFAVTITFKAKEPGFDEYIQNDVSKNDLSNIIELGYLEILEDGYGFTRSIDSNIEDAYVSARLIRSLGLRKGDFLTGVAKEQYEGKSIAVVYVSKINGMPVQALTQRAKFDDLVPIYPDQMIRLEKDKIKNDITIRMIDLLCPIGKGQRALIVAPPKAGKTTIIKKIATNIMNNNPNLKLFVLLVDERPEEVTDMKRSVPGEVVYSTFDESPKNHIKVAEMLIERAKRQVEIGCDVVIIMDSLTRLARAYNAVTESSGKTLSGGIDPAALHFPKKLFGSARNIEHGGSLTIIATTLVDTGSRMDDVIFEEFKGTGNMELRLDRRLSEKRIFPAIDLNQSSTRRDDLLLSQKELEANIALRTLLENNEKEATKTFINLLLKTKNNKKLCEQLILQVRSLEK